jgi:hypothetical protein
MRRGEPFFFSSLCQPPPIQPPLPHSLKTVTEREKKSKKILKYSPLDNFISLADTDGSSSEEEEEEEGGGGRSRGS